MWPGVSGAWWKACRGFWVVVRGVCLMGRGVWVGHLILMIDICILAIGNLLLCIQCFISYLLVSN